MLQRIQSCHFQGIVQDRSQETEKQANIGITDGSAGFGHDLNTFLKALNNRLHSREAALVGTRGLAAQHSGS